MKRGTDLVYGGGLEPRVHVETPREVLRERELLGVGHPRPRRRARAPAGSERSDDLRPKRQA